MRRLLLGALAGLVLLVLASPLALQAALERGLLNTQLDAALERATGREITLGRITLGLSLPPRITLLDARVANVAGSAQPDFARIGRLEVLVALRPLLDGRIEIRDLHLVEAEIWLERDADGQPNWSFGGTAPGNPGPAMPLPPIRIEASRLHLPDGLPGPLGVDSLDLRRLPDGATRQLQGRVRLREEAVQLDARLGAGGALNATLTGTGFRLGAEGLVAWRLGDPGWAVALSAEVASPERLMALLRVDAALPPLGPLTGKAQLGPNGALSALHIQSGASEPWPGIRLTRAELSAAALDQPMHFAAEGQRGGQRATLNLTLPHPRQAFSARAPMPVTARLSAGPARLNATGAFTWSNPLGAAPFDVTLTAPNLAPLGPLLGLELPAWRDVEAHGRLRRQGAAGLQWQAARLNARGIAATGAIELNWTTRPNISGQIRFATLDLEALSPSAPAPRAAATNRVIPDIALPVGELRGFDATLDLQADRLAAAGLNWRALRMRATLAAGRLNLNDFSVTSPGGPLSGRIGWDVASEPPRASLALRSGGNGLDVAAIRRELGAGIGVQGPVEVALDLTARGATTRALAASLSGAAGLAMVEGRLSHAGMLRIGPDLTRILLMGRAPPEGVTLRCFALSFAAEDGLLQSEALLLESSAGRITGSLAINLRNETLAAHLRPDLRVFGATMRAPVGVGGTLAAPRVGVEPAQALAQVVGDTVANRLWRSSTVEWLRRDSGDADCPAQLRQARLGQAGREPAAAAPIIPLVPRELQAPVQEVFRGLGSGIGGLLGRR
jgi:uncharacterized protein involved in outer membrane biogenesis